MKLLTIELKNFKPFRDLTIPDDDAELPGGLILIRGPNSTGKSSLFEAILWGLWGSSAVGLTNEELISFASSFCRVVLTFDILGVEYKIDRSYDPANGMAVVMYVQKENVWKKIADKDRSVSRKLEEILNLELKQALSTLLVRQGEVAEIANATPSTLRDLLIEVYNIELLDDMSGQLSYLEKDLTAREDALRSDFVPPDRIRSEIKELKAGLKDKEKLLKEKETEVKKVEKLLESVPDADALQEIYKLMRDLEKKESRLEQSIESSQKDLSASGLIEADSTIIKARQAQLEENLEKLEVERREIEVRRTEIDQEVGAMRGIARDLKEKIDTLKGIECDHETESTECPTCSKPLTAKEREDIIKEYESTIKDGQKQTKELEQERKELATRFSGVEKKQRTISRAIDAVIRLEDKQKDIENARKAVEISQKAVDEAIKGLGVKNLESMLKKHGVESILELREKVRTLQVQTKSLKNECDTMSENLEDTRTQIKKKESEEVKMKEAAAEIQSLKSLSEHTKYARRKLVSGFITDYVFQKRLIGIIRGATNQYLRAFTNGQYTSIDLKPTPGRGRGGSGLALQIWDERDKARKNSGQLSFGDRTAVSLGLRLGISRTMSSIRPLKESPAIAPRVRCVLLDEPLGGLDKTRRTSVVSNLVNDQSFEQILLITHTDIQDWEGVPVIEITKSGSTSKAVLRR